MGSILQLLFALNSYAQTCASNQYLVSGHYRSGYVRYDGTIVSATNVKSYCKDKSEIHENWYSKFKNKKPRDWPISLEKFKEWKVDEKELLIEILETFPSDLLRQNVFGLYRSYKSKDFPNPATSADGIIVIYDSAFESKSNLRRILSHEFAHQLYIDLSDKDLRDYQYATNWFPIDDKASRYISRKDGFVQDDGRVSPEEDFANNIEFFLNDPNTLKNTTLNAYQWIKSRYGDKFKYGKADKKK